MPKRESSQFEPIAIKVAGDRLSGRRISWSGQCDARIRLRYIGEVARHPLGHMVDGGAAKNNKAHVRGNVVCLMKANEVITYNLGLRK
jgi:hypothetical protein